jgi:hypothetical protein
VQDVPFLTCALQHKPKHNTTTTKKYLTQRHGDTKKKRILLFVIETQEIRANAAQPQPIPPRPDVHKAVRALELPSARTWSVLILGSFFQDQNKTIPLFAAFAYLAVQSLNP